MERVPTIPKLPRISQSPGDHDFFQSPYAAYSRFHDIGGTFFWEDYGHVCFAGFEDVNALLRDRRFGREILHVTNRAALGWSEVPEHLAAFHEFDSHSLLEREPPAHTRLRGLVNRAFVSRQVEHLRPRITTLAHSLIDAFETDQTVDLLPAYAEPIPVIVIAELLGVPTDMAGQLLKWSHAMVAMYQFNRTRAVEDAAVEATIAFSDFMQSHVDERRAVPRDDLISHLISAEQSGDTLSTDELITNAVLLLNAGHEATVHSIGNAVNTLLRYNCDVASLFADAATAAATVEELLRFDPPLHMFTRYALEDLDYCGQTFKQGEKAGLLLGAANHDPARFDKPDRFDPARRDSGHVSFGGGIHFCVGAPLARLELQVALPILFARLPSLKLADQPRYADRYHFHGLDRLEVVL